MSEFCSLDTHLHAPERLPCIGKKLFVHHVARMGQRHGSMQKLAIHHQFHNNKNIIYQSRGQKQVTCQKTELKATWWGSQRSNGRGLPWWATETKDHTTFTSKIRHTTCLQCLQEWIKVTVWRNHLSDNTFACDHIANSRLLVRGWAGGILVLYFYLSSFQPSKTLCL
jgi:hypothetical protein